MSVAAVNVSIRKIEENGRGDFEGCRSDDAIARAESDLGLTFPPSYREFLSRLGVGSIGGFEFFGLCSIDGSPSGGEPDMPGVTLAERRIGDFPLDLVIVSSDGMGGFYVIDQSSCDENDESPVRVWERGPGLTEYVAGSFGEYFKNEVEEAYREC